MSLWILQIYTYFEDNAAKKKVLIILYVQVVYHVPT